MTLLLAALLTAACALSRMLAGAVARAARRMGFLDAPGGRKAHAAPVPLGGGLAVAGTLVAILAAATVAAANAATVEARLPPDAARAFGALADGLLTRLPTLGLLGACAGAVTILGLVDDARGLSPRLKLCGQALAAAVLCLWAGPEPFRITAFFPYPVLGFALTVVWIVAVTNAFNFIDNMDGFCATLATVSCLLFTVLAFQTEQWLIAAFFATLAGALLGFLPLNWPPARLFLGDAGSLPVGFLIASLTVLFTFYAYDESPWVLSAPFLVLAVPLFDMATVLWIRLRAGRPLTVGDRNHFSHRLGRLGLSPPQILAVAAALAAAIGMTATFLYLLPRAAAALALVQAVGILAAVWILERAGRRPPSDGAARP